MGRSRYKTFNLLAALESFFYFLQFNNNENDKKSVVKNIFTNFYLHE